MYKVSERQQAILDFIRDEVRAKGYPPSVREIGEAVGLASSSTVHGHLDRLEKKGFIRRDSSKPRTIELLSDGRSEPVANFSHSFIYAPILNQVTAKEPIMTAKNIVKYFPLPAHMVGENENVFLLTIIDDTMIEVGIHNEDYIIARQQQTANSGDIVVAIMENNEATVKTFYREKNHIRLQPENQTYRPIYLHHVTILGKVIGLFRNLREQQR